MAEELVFPYSNKQSDESNDPNYENQLKSSGSKISQNLEFKIPGSQKSKDDEVDQSKDENIFQYINQLSNIQQVKSKKKPKKIQTINIIETTNIDKNQESHMNSTPNQSFNSQNNSVINSNTSAQDLDLKFQNITENVKKIQDYQIKKNGLQFSDFPQNDKYTCLLEDQIYNEDMVNQQTYSIEQQDKEIDSLEELNNEQKTFQTKQNKQDNKFFYQKNTNHESDYSINFNQKSIQDKKQYYRPPMKQQLKQKEQYHQRNFQLQRVNNSTNSYMNQNKPDIKIDYPDLSKIDQQINQILSNKTKTEQQISIQQLNQMNQLNQSIKLNQINQISTNSQSLPCKMPLYSQSQKKIQVIPEKKHEIENFVKGKFEYSANNLIEVKQQIEQNKQEIIFSDIPLQQSLYCGVKKQISNPQSLSHNNSIETQPSIFKKQVSLEIEKRDNIETFQESKMQNVGGIDSFTAPQQKTDFSKYKSLFSQWEVFNINDLQYKRNDDFKFENHDKLKSFFNFDSDQD